MRRSAQRSIAVNGDLSASRIRGTADVVIGLKQRIGQQRACRRQPVYDALALPLAFDQAGEARLRQVLPGHRGSAARNGSQSRHVQLGAIALSRWHCSRRSSSQRCSVNAISDRVRPYFTDVTSLADVYHFGTQHFDPPRGAHRRRRFSRSVTEMVPPALARTRGMPARLKIRVIRWVYAAAG